MRRLYAFLAFFSLFSANLEGGGKNRPRVIATTDGEIDDRCSMVRFLLYANEFDIEGMIYSSSRFHWKGHKWAGEKWIQEDIRKYAQVYPLLKKHDPGYPTPQKLLEKVYVGNTDNVGEMEKDTPGSDRIVKVLLEPKPGPVYLQAWGGTNTIARALLRIEKSFPEKKKEVSRKAVIYIILDQDDTFRKYIRPNWPELQVIVSRRQFAAIAYSWKKIIPGHLHRFFSKKWIVQNIVQGHGALCAAYPVKYFISEGDTPSFFHQIRRGLGGMVRPDFGSWGGRFKREKGRSEVWSDAKDDGNLFKPIWRWAEDFQNDWAARADWCIKDPKEANHNPVAVLNGDRSLRVLEIRAKPGSVVNLSARGSKDPDGDKLSYRWWLYRDPSSYKGKVPIEGKDEVVAKVHVPQDASGRTLHIILTVKDQGTPPLCAYRRALIKVQAP